MTDAEIIEALADKCGGHVPLAERLRVTRQTLWDWKQRGIYRHSRLAVEALAGEYGLILPEGFADAWERRDPPLRQGDAA